MYMRILCRLNTSERNSLAATPRDEMALVQTSKHNSKNVIGITHSSSKSTHFFTHFSILKMSLVRCSFILGSPRMCITRVCMTRVCMMLIITPWLWPQCSVALYKGCSISSWKMLIKLVRISRFLLFCT